MKKSLSLLLALALALLCGCTTSQQITTSANDTSSEHKSTQSSATASSVPEQKSDVFTDYDCDASFDEATAGKITFNGTSATATAGATVSGGKVTVTTPGTYVVTGTATEGQLIVNVAKTEKVQLVLKDAQITCAQSAPIYVQSADKVKITLVEGTVNRLTDGSMYTNLVNNTEPTACLFSKDDLTINGSGALSITANYNNGIATKNDLRIVSGTIFVKAKNHGIKGKDSVCIADGQINISAGNDGIKANEETEPSKGYILITGGSISIIATDDGLQAVTGITISGGKVTVTAEGKPTNCEVTPKIASGSLTVVAD